MLLLLFAAASASYVDVGRLHIPRIHTSHRCRSFAPLCMADEPFDMDDAMKQMDKAVSKEDYAEAARLKKLIDAEVAANRAQLMRQLSGESEASAGGADGAAAEEAPVVTLADSLAPGQVLVANPERFCSLNPFARPVKDLSRFGIQGPINRNEPGLSPDLVAQMLPVLVLVEHNKEGSRALLMERRTGALMGDVSMEEYGPCSISPLWLGGTAKQNSLYVLHDVDEAGGTTEIGGGLYLGGWDKIKPKVVDSSVSDARLKFFIGATEWSPGQLEDELKAGAWLNLEVPPSVVTKDRVGDWRPGKPKPVWTEMMNYIDEDNKKVCDLVKQIYGDRG